MRGKHSLLLWISTYVNILHINIICSVAFRSGIVHTLNILSLIRVLAILPEDQGSSSRYSQPSVTPVSEELMSSSGSSR